MTASLRRPALAPAALRAAPVRLENPSDFLQQHYLQVWQTQMHDMPFVNPALRVEAIGFIRHQGDWLGMVVTPWFVNLFLLNGGGTLWQDISAGARRAVVLPCGALVFIADDDPKAGLLQYCPLIAPVMSLSDMASARQVAVDALKAVLTVPPVTEATPEPAAPPAQKALLQSGTPDAVTAASRRGFMRRLAGHQ